MQSLLLLEVVVEDERLPALICAHLCREDRVVRPPARRAHAACGQRRRGRVERCTRRIRRRVACIRDGRAPAQIARVCALRVGYWQVVFGAVQQSGAAERWRGIRSSDILAGRGADSRLSQLPCYSSCSSWLLLLGLRCWLLHVLLLLRHNLVGSLLQHRICSLRIVILSTRLPQWFVGRFGGSGRFGGQTGEGLLRVFEGSTVRM